ncbi:glutamate synthase subunit beta [Chryseobacterium sp. BIGb0232]|uniref:glutamate synthase subunit beta n=1 Tax=Chryseobacterium sp. BIGb0232 TaxID=2940598 RepID=UPI000F49F7C9|nr:glutamate synthase subunit beta [Chryseobacterium sp. BIGb0232]MCS4302096.1 glutamate synthase (NADPH/NADH) small chain [Chryseobacterium sp. BIGb0232]ROS18042.1 glutamate synthase (NADPH/NADH) small chain [Chryseobacterium nakagawai]
MGKINGFLIHERELPPKLEVEKRLQDYKEFIQKPSDEQLKCQSARCMDCGIPFCQSGCPLGNLIPEFNEAVYQKQWEKAYRILISTNNFPEFTGRICPAPCESACVLGINDQPVTIEEIEKNIIEIAFEQGFARPKSPLLRTNKRVAVVGSGPAGLAAAYQLNQMGHYVTVFERDPEIGGLLRFGIPDFKLDKNIVERRVQWMKEEGVLFSTGVNVGIDYSVEQLNRDFEAIVLATGSTVPKELVIPNHDAKGIYFAMDFLKQSNKKVSGIPFEEEEIDAKGKKVVVIGGGDTGSDCIGTSNRQGAEIVYQIYYKPMQPMERDETMPWPAYPALLQITSSHEEGCERMWSVNSKEFVKDENGNLKGVRLIEAEWTKDSDDGKWNLYTEKPGSEFILECDLVFIALGYTHVEHKGLVEGLDIHLDPKGNLIGNNKEYKTNQDKVFSCGDARKGQSLVVWAIAEGRECAEKVNEFLISEM